MAALIQQLTVAEATPDGYDRSLFRLWADDDDDGCDTRAEVLLAQAVDPPTIRGNCQLSGGTWYSEYDGVRMNGPETVDVDHVVALAEAWASGARDWSLARRDAYANDLGVPWALIAVSPAVNRAKGSADPSGWLPGRSAELCPYLAAWIAVKLRWSLSVDVVERRTLSKLVEECPNTQISVPIAPHD